MTAGLDIAWRRKAAKAVTAGHNMPIEVLDVACGTGDLSIALSMRKCHVAGVDLSEEMLGVAINKAEQLDNEFIRPTFDIANAEHLPYPDNTFDAVTCAFGVRNFVHLDVGLKEMIRVIKPTGRIVILELSTPDNPLLRPFYNLYSRHIIPLLGKVIASNREAYTYLPNSIEHFPKGDTFIKCMMNAGAVSATQRKLTLGVCRMYTATKPNSSVSI